VVCSARCLAWHDEVATPFITIYMIFYSFHGKFGSFNYLLSQNEFSRDAGSST
jgi:hypothetical protein